MRYPLCHSPQHQSLPLTWGIVVLVLMLAMIVQPVQCLSAQAQEDVDLELQDISLTTSDQVTLAASWVVPHASEENQQRRPVVILLHDYGLNRRDWSFFIPDLAQRGYNVLALDLRGHGQSEGRGQYSPASLLQQGHLDVLAALEWIEDNTQSDADQIFLIGAGVGADIAYMSSGKFPKQIQATVAISPSYSSILDGSFVDIRPRAILFCATVGSHQGSSMLATESLANFTQDPKKVILYQGSAHGLAMFYKHPELRQEIFTWLSQ
ncbi:alpha/beta fold hydrolase [candidate division KSB3 bacterium]|uniref:Alpha/beta fold hydrolase n=1 Tax=candidate division KSB3 bacterium TaxID=2044937 RepID=A0A9D5JRP3_9BACT|nr:alpha/beta fold hydrolase [candidate division KSB3 bacterium]MBD3323012.1 alpha/beta fold hydrolase [candidate division KSB3 bacterium]